MRNNLERYDREFLEAIGQHWPAAQPQPMQRAEWSLVYRAVDKRDHRPWAARRSLPLRRKSENGIRVMTIPRGN